MQGQGGKGTHITGDNGLPLFLQNNVILKNLVMSLNIILQHIYDGCRVMYFMDLSITISITGNLDCCQVFTPTNCSSDYPI